MATETQNLFDKASHPPAQSDLFGGTIHTDVSARDVFAGDETLFKVLDHASRPALLSKAAVTASRTAGWFTPTHIILSLNILVISTILIVLFIRPAVPVTVVQPQLHPYNRVAEMLPEPTISETVAASLKPAASWQLADQLVQTKDFDRAYYIYYQLNETLTPGIPADEWLQDLLALKMGLCLNALGKTSSDTGRLFTQALQSRSPTVRAMAHYHMMFLEFKSHHNLAARQHAYQTLALSRMLEDALSSNLEADCYFLLCESITREILHLGNKSMDLPGSLWSDSLLPESLPLMDQTQMKAFLQNGRTLIQDGILAPRIRTETDFVSGSRYSAIGFDGPFEEWITRFASEARLHLVWDNQIDSMRSRPVSMYLPNTTEQWFAEIAAGSAGLVAEFSGEGLSLYNPAVYQNLSEHRKQLTREAVIVWRRFLLRYRGDHRCPNAHFALGLLQESLGETVAALGEYKLVATQYSSNPLAPFALLNSSHLKTNIHDYTGAKSDLTELIVQYPECKLIDQASLYLAQATLGTGRFTEAMSMFKKVYNLDLSKDSRRDAAYGVAESAFHLAQYAEAKKWYLHAIQLTADMSDRRIYTAYFMLGKSLIALKDFEQASLALIHAMNGPLTTEEYVETVLQLAEADTRQEKFVAALNILENVPEDKLTQEDSCEVLIARTRILREIDLTETALSLLRRKIEFVANAQLRARLSVELAKCLIQLDDLSLARKQLADALIALPSGALSRETSLLLIDVTMRLNQYDQAKSLCLQFLNNTTGNVPEFRSALHLLGQIYTQLKEHDKAAMAYVGVFDSLGRKGEGS